MPIGTLWQTLLETPLINLLVALSAIAFGSYGLAILLLTLMIRVLTFPLTLKTLRATRKMQELQPRLQEIQKKYSDPKRRSEETMKLYRETGINPLGCLGPQLIQFPILIALYQVVRITVGDSPEAMLYLETRLYDFDFIQSAIPLSTHFLFIDLGETGNIFLAVLIFAASWLQQRISTSRKTAVPGSQQAQMNTMMQWMMPLMFAWFAIVFPAGLALYWAATTIIGLVLHWMFLGPGDFTWSSLIPGPLRSRMARDSRAGVPPSRQAAAVAASDAADSTETRTGDGTGSRNQRNRRRGSRRPGAETTGTDARTGRRRRRPRR